MPMTSFTQIAITCAPRARITGYGTYTRVIITAPYRPAKLHELYTSTMRHFWASGSDPIESRLQRRLDWCEWLKGIRDTIVEVIM